ncbi:hypothetical protein EDD85DRAFT_1029994 [Armillaria nabsnona]|nr:hypothetical protein EDD85DRAFT_1029994 [Armillaria nabsnona]
MLSSLVKYILRSIVAMYRRISDIPRLGPYIRMNIFRGIMDLILGTGPRRTTNNPPLRSLTQGGVCPGDNSQTEKELMRKEIEKLQDLETELATRYGMAGFGEIDSAEVFAEAKHRAFPGDAQCIHEAKQMDELCTLRHKRAMYPGGL